MTERGRPRTWKRRRAPTELVYDGIRLVPATAPRRGKENSWYLPGGEVATTAELVKRANARGVDIVLHERIGAKVRITRLN